MSAVCGDTLSVSDVLKALALLLTPVTCGEDRPAGFLGKDTVTGVLQKNLEALNKHLCAVGSGHLKSALSAEVKYFFHPDISVSTQWTFVSTVLQLLHILTMLLKEARAESHQHGNEGEKEQNLKPKRPQDAPPLSSTALSIGQTQTIRNALQFITRLGICPNLNPGVGIPWQYRSKLLTAPGISTLSGGTTEEGTESKRQKLNLCVSVLISLLDVRDVAGFVMSSHLNDLLAGLLQLSNAYPATGSGMTILPEKIPEISKAATEAAVTSENKHEETVFKADSSIMVCSVVEQTIAGMDAVTKEEGTTDIIIDYLDNADVVTVRLEAGADHYKRCLEKVLSSTSPDVIIRELMVLQAGIPQRVQNARQKSSSGGHQTTLHPPPPWLRKACSHILQQTLSGPKGIMHVFCAMAAGVEPSSPGHWKCCEAVARIVSRSPIQASQVDQYVEGVAKQLFEMLHMSKGSDTAHLPRLVGAMVNEMVAVHKEHFYQRFFAPMMQPLSVCLDHDDQYHDGDVVVGEDALSTCLGNLHKVVVVGQQPQASILSTLQPVTGVLWILFGLTHNGVQNIRRIVQELLVNYLQHLGSIGAATCVRLLSIGRGTSDAESTPFPTEMSVRFVSGSSGGLKAVHADGDNISRLGEKEQVEAAIDVLGNLKSSGVAGELLVLLLKELTQIISLEAQQSDVLLPARVERLEVREQRAKDLKRRVVLLHLLASVCETFGSECLTDTRQILQFVKVSLEHGVAVCRNTSEEEMVIFETETMSMAMGLLTTVLAGAIQLDEEHRKMMEEMLPLLAIIGQGHPDEFVKEMAEDIRIAIATRGAVWSSLQESRSNSHKKASTSEEKEQKIKITGRSGPPIRPLIEALSDTPTSGPPKTPVVSVQPVPSPSVSVHRDPTPLSAQSSSTPQAGRSSHSKDRITNISDASSAGRTLPESGEKSSLHTVFEQLCDPLIPVRGHGLMALAKLVQEKDPETLSKKDAVQKIFQENMHHGDSYLYLAAINGMSALADRFPESVVPVLAEEFAGFTKQDSASPEQHITADHRLKLGEVLMRATWNLGEMVPKYRDVLLAAVFAGAHDRDPAVRASSVSNLAEICHLLRFSLAPVLQEVLSCCSGLLTGEEVIVQRAAALTLARILEGLDIDAFTVLESNLRDLYRLLKKLHEQDPDDAVRLHANMALVQLDSVARGFLFPKQTLQKRIQVLPDVDTFR